MKHPSVPALLLALILLAAALPVSAQEAPAETVLFTGVSAAADPWGVIASVHVNSVGFDPSAIVEDGYFAITYTGEKAGVTLALAEWDTNVWGSVAPAATTEKDGLFTSTYDYADCVAAYGTADFADLDAICAQKTGDSQETVVTRISWYGPAVAVELNETEMLFTGSQSGSSYGASLGFFFTAHVGGAWDASSINPGSYLYVEYTGAREGVYLAFVSHSGAPQRWVAVYPDETGMDEAGRWYSIFRYDNFARAFGTNFARLDQIQLYCAGNEKVTLKRVAYFAGEGEPADTSDGAWDRADTGIAFIGDSIVENPLVDGSHLGCIDWNGILGRDNCSNYGIGGQTTAELVRRIDEVARRDYAQVVFLCGINDIGRGLTNSQITDNYRTMINALLAARPDRQIYIISVLPTTPAFYTGAQGSIVALNQALQALCSETENVTYVDCHSQFVGSDGYCMTGLTFDGLHPDLTGYSRIAAVLNPILGGEYASLEAPAGVVIQDSTVPAAPPAPLPESGSGVSLITEPVTVDSGWQHMLQANAWAWGGELDPAVFAPGCRVRLTLQSTPDLWSVHFVCQSVSGVWAQVDKNVNDLTLHGDGCYTAEFTFDELAAVYGSDDLSDLGAVHIYCNSDAGAQVTLTGAVCLGE